MMYELVVVLAKIERPYQIFFQLSSGNSLVAANGRIRTPCAGYICLTLSPQCTEFHFTVFLSIRY